MHLTHISKLKATAHSLSISRDADSFCIMHILGLILTQAQIYFFFPTHLLFLHRWSCSVSSRGLTAGFLLYGVN